MHCLWYRFLAASSERLGRDVSEDEMRLDEQVHIPLQEEHDAKKKPGDKQLAKDNDKLKRDLAKLQKEYRQ